MPTLLGRVSPCLYLPDVQWGSILCQVLYSPMLVGYLCGEVSSMPSPSPGISATIPARSITLRLPQGSGGGLHPGHVHKASQNSPFSSQLGRRSATSTGPSQEAAHTDVSPAAVVKSTGVRAETNPWAQLALPCNLEPAP